MPYDSSHFRLTIPLPCSQRLYELLISSEWSLVFPANTPSENTLVNTTLQKAWWKKYVTKHEKWTLTTFCSSLLLSAWSTTVEKKSTNSLPPPMFRKLKIRMTTGASTEKIWHKPYLLTRKHTEKLYLHPSDTRYFVIISQLNWVVWGCDFHFLALLADNCMILKHFRGLVAALAVLFWNKVSSFRLAFLGQPKSEAVTVGLLGGGCPCQLVRCVSFPTTAPQLFSGCAAFFKAKLNREPKQSTRGPRVRKESQSVDLKVVPQNSTLPRGLRGIDHGWQNAEKSRESTLGGVDWFPNQTPHLSPIFG